MKELNIKAAIKRNGLTAKEVAKRMGITEIGLSYIINGQTKNGKRIEPNPGINQLQRIAEAIGCELFDLFDVDEQRRTMQHNAPTIICPHCGKHIYYNISIGKDPKTDV